MTSIIVRKHCQPVLDAAGYPMFHATISDDYHHPHLVIYTTCGKPFVEVHGVNFSRRKPTIVESEYSAELLQQWLDRHQADFEEYVDAYTDYHSAKQVKEDKREVGDNVTLSVTDIDAQRVQIKRPYDVIDSNGNRHQATSRVTFETDSEKITNIEWSYGSFYPPKVAAFLKIPKKYFKEARQMIEECNAYRKVSDRFYAAQKKIYTCEI